MLYCPAREMASYDRMCLRETKHLANKIITEDLDGAMKVQEWLFRSYIGSEENHERIDALQAKLAPWLERAERIRAQQPKDKGKLYALHAPEVECIGKGKARKPYEFGVKVSIAVTAKQGLMVGARAFPNNPYDGHTLAEQIEQTTILLQDVPGEPKPKSVLVDLGYRGVDHELAPVQVIHRGKAKTLTKAQRRWLKRRQAVEPAIGHAKHDHGLDRCYLKGAEGDALHAVLCCARQGTTSAGCCGRSPGWD